MSTAAESYSPDLSHELRRIESWDTGLVMATVMLLGIGSVMVYSATINPDTLNHSNGELTLRKHLLHVGIGIGAMVGAMAIPYRAWKRLVYPALLLVTFLLLLVTFFGTTAGNARRWLSFPGFNVQPAEMAKLAFVIFLAYSLDKKGERIRSFAVAFIPHLSVCGLLIMLCLTQPDFGTSLILVMLMFAMLFVAGTRLSYISLFVCVGGFLVFQAIASNSMRLGRVMMWLDPWGHRSDGGYQMVNSLIAIGSGGLTGQSLGFGGQTLTGYLPEGHTDFILAVLAEQLGFMGVLVVITLFGLLLSRGISTAVNARDDFGRFLAFGITLLLGLQAVINMLVAVALIPTKGLTLPFVSYGGSSMLVSCFAVGILLSISRDTRKGWVEQLAGVQGQDEASSDKEPEVSA
ncbi:MAG: putative lipid II flippase FtsW [Deltaproteobacteria bacterium]|nr:putative lipid II flippase FtsW [Deltaproteobacteria bacterium]